jgi:hypothetical protein
LKQGANGNSMGDFWKTEAQPSGASPLPHLTVFTSQRVGGGLPPMSMGIYTTSIE